MCKQKFCFVSEKQILSQFLHRSSRSGVELPISGAQAFEPKCSKVTPAKSLKKVDIAIPTARVLNRSPV